ncbi:MAG: hypothetical protein RI949_3283 [Pseudomonadota bacterium]|jgi:hypothetical protein
MSIVDIDRLMRSVAQSRQALDPGHDKSVHTLARVAMSARSGPGETDDLATLANLARAEVGTEPVLRLKNANIANIARQAASKAKLAAERQQFGAKAKALLERLVHLQGWSDSDRADGLDAIARSPRDAYELFGQMLSVHLGEGSNWDGRVRCTDCQNLRAGRCAKHKAAGLDGPDVGPELAALPQRCAAFASTV